MIPIEQPSIGVDNKFCAFCGRPTALWTALPDRTAWDQVGICEPCSEAREPKDVPTKEAWYRKLDADAAVVVVAGAVERERKTCTVYSESCPEHGFFHGAEAEELREGIEAVIDQGGDARDFERALRALLDRVDARDSLAYVEAKKVEGG